MMTQVCTVSHCSACTLAIDRWFWVNVNDIVMSHIVLFVEIKHGCYKTTHFSQYVVITYILATEYVQISIQSCPENIQVTLQALWADGTIAILSYSHTAREWDWGTELTQLSFFEMTFSEFSKFSESWQNQGPVWLLETFYIWQQLHSLM